ncbi:hypothetical protein P700755_002339 [Psychroflexus torquis ATCC 700755]|uniref:Uncharacterized protein n=1 Tax=Psychroflexus torquis (strain ATCC 700755 / CIP 106069 / ACAM 623) TaxID=313595 RepID=K4IH54_PSYTT|nr:hypothetical protein [Psychroflexus torquis]AFU69118.1 hypothetical protein P700755_002339 [Psychroflexus torquis ATCC 700755]
MISSPVLSQSGSVEGRIIFEDNARLSATMILQELHENTIPNKENSFTFKEIEEGIFALYQIKPIPPFIHIKSIEYSES